MAQLDDALNSILGNQQAMAQIMALANSLTEEGGALEQAQQNSEELPALSEGNRAEDTMGEDRDLVLLGAVKPFLKPERREKLEQALELVRMLRMLRGALSSEDLENS